jgi:hypothetical protein
MARPHTPSCLEVHHHILRHPLKFVEEERWVCLLFYLILTQCFVGGGGRSAVQVVKGTDAITAAGGGGAADCFNTSYCGGGGTVRRMYCV